MDILRGEDRLSCFVWTGSGLAHQWRNSWCAASVALGLSIGIRRETIRIGGFTSVRMEI